MRGLSPAYLDRDRHAEGVKLEQDENIDGVRTETGWRPYAGSTCNFTTGKNDCTDVI